MCKSCVIDQVKKDTEPGIKGQLSLIYYDSYKGIAPAVACVTQNKSTLIQPGRFGKGKVT